MKKIALLFLIAFLNSYHPIPAHADCMVSEEGRTIKIETKECRKLSPAQDGSIRKKAGENWESMHLEKLYSGALLIDTHGREWVYPTEDADPCKSFPIGGTTEKAAYQTCCDTGTWGKCVFGGSFLGDVGGKPINSFQ